MKRRNKEILDAREAKGSVHDFKLYKDTIGKNVDESIMMQTDLGYLGIEKLHANSQVPYKESKRHKLTKRKRHITKGSRGKGSSLSILTQKLKHLKSWRILIETIAKSTC